MSAEERLKAAGTQGRQLSQACSGRKLGNLCGKLGLVCSSSQSTNDLSSPGNRTFHAFTAAV